MAVDGRGAAGPAISIDDGVEFFAGAICHPHLARPFHADPLTVALGDGDSRVAIDETRAGTTRWVAMDMPMT